MLEVVSGLSVNFFKGKSIGVRVDDHLLTPFANVMGCRARCQDLFQLPMLVFHFAVVSLPNPFDSP